MSSRQLLTINPIIAQILPQGAAGYSQAKHAFEGLHPMIDSIASAVGLLY
jgi:hypothetical protein